jgi:hypothetical protein
MRRQVNHYRRVLLFGDAHVEANVARFHCIRRARIQLYDVVFGLYAHQGHAESSFFKHI